MAAKEKKGLGAGLDVLFGAMGLEDEAESELLILPVSRVEPRKDQPRQHFDEELLEELAESIRQYGLIQPVVARKLESGYYQIIAGERRWRASRMAGLKEIPVRVIEADDRRAAELALVENLQREDLNPIEEALGYRKLMEDYGLTQEETAKSVGRSRPAVTNALRLLGLHPDLQEMIEKGQMSAGHGRALASLGQELQLQAAEQVCKRGLSVRRTEELAAKLQRQAAKAQEPEAEEPLVDYAAEVSEELSRILGRKARLVAGRRSGRIELDYYDPEDRERLIQALRKLTY